MDANPASDLTFKWKFNTTANTVDIPVRTLDLEESKCQKYFSLYFILKIYDVIANYFVKDKINYKICQNHL